MMGKQMQAYLCAGSAVLVWSTVATVFKVSLRYLDIVQLVYYSRVNTGNVTDRLVAGQGASTPDLY